MVDSSISDSNQIKFTDPTHGGIRSLSKPGAQEIDLQGANSIFGAMFFSKRKCQSADIAYDAGGGINRVGHCDLGESSEWELRALVATPADGENFYHRHFS